MRFNEQVQSTKTAKKETKKPRELPKAGSYNSQQLEKSKDIPWRK